MEQISGSQVVTRGMPQGSGLGSHLFTFLSVTYTNNMAEGGKCNISKFADPTKSTGIESRGGYKEASGKCGQIK